MIHKISQDKLLTHLLEGTYSIGDRISQLDTSSFLRLNHAYGRKISGDL